MGLFHNPFNYRHVRLAGLESNMGIQRCRETWETRLACGALDLIYELADELTYLAGVPSGY